MAFTFFPAEFFSVIIFGFALGNGQGFPLVSLNQFSKKNNLTYMIGIMSELPIDGFGNGMSLIADIDKLFQIIVCQWSYGFKKTTPALFPSIEQIFFGFVSVLKFYIAMSPGFLTVFGQKVGPSAQHIADQMFYNYGNAVGIFGKFFLHFFKAELFKGFVAKVFIILKLFDSTCQV